MPGANQCEEVHTLPDTGTVIWHCILQRDHDGLHRDTLRNEWDLP